MKRVVLFLMILSVLAAGCAKTPAATQVTTEATVETAGTETVPTELPEETVAETVPAEPEKMAECITEGLRVWVGQQDVTQALTDQDHYSKIPVAASATLTLESETPFYSLYAIWDTLPGLYTLVGMGESLIAASRAFCMNIFLCRSR